MFKCWGCQTNSRILDYLQYSSLTYYTRELRHNSSCRLSSVAGYTVKYCRLRLLLRKYCSNRYAQRATATINIRKFLIDENTKNTPKSPIASQRVHYTIHCTWLLHCFTSHLSRFAYETSRRKTIYVAMNNTQYGNRLAETLIAVT